jgi:hypothetical protein
MAGGWECRSVDMGVGRNGFCCDADGPGESGAIRSNGERMSWWGDEWVDLGWVDLGWVDLGWGSCVGGAAVGGSGVAAMGFRTETTEWRSWESQAIAAAIASPSAYCTPINADHERMLFALVSESASSENLPESVGLAIRVPLLAVLARAEECCSRTNALGASLISRAHCPRQLAALAGYSVAMWAAK